MYYSNSGNCRIPVITKFVESPDSGVKITFDDMAAEYEYVFSNMHHLIVADAKMLAFLYKTNHYWPLNCYIELSDIIYVASNPDDDCLFWEVIEGYLGPDTDNAILSQLDTAYSLFKLDLWEQCISPYIDEETRAQCRYIAHYHNDGLWIATGD